MTTQPPNDRQAEESLIGSLLIDGSVINLPINPDDFFIRQYGDVWSAAQRLHRRGEPVDWVTVHAELETMGIVGDIDLPNLIAITNNTPSSLHAQSYSEIVREFARRRELLTVASGIGKICHDTSISLNGQISGFISRLQEINPEKQIRYQIRSAEFALQPQAPIDWLIGGLISAGSVCLAVGPPGSKKTYALLDAGVCVAAGQPWLEMETSPRPVLVVDEESGEKRLSRRIGQVLRGHFADETTKIEFVSLAQFDLRSFDDAYLLADLVERTQARLVIIDALADIMPGGDENLVKDTHPVMMRLRKIADETNAAIWIIHHANKLGGYRGSTAISGAVDLLVMVDSKPNSDIINFEVTKARDIEPFKFTAQAHFSDGQFWMTRAEIKQGTDTLSKSQRFVINYIKKNGGSATITEISGNADICSADSARRAVYSLADKGIIFRSDSGGPGKLATYSIKGDETCENDDS
jgi:hypothetical protein